jgi:F-type H+-transporting ATPase subunit gamma
MAFVHQKVEHTGIDTFPKKRPKAVAILLGSDLGMVGSFNESLMDFYSAKARRLLPNVVLLLLGERLYQCLSGPDYCVARLFSTPDSVDSVTPVVGAIVEELYEKLKVGELDRVYLFHNSPKSRTEFSPGYTRLLPLDQKWLKDLKHKRWPTKYLPEVVLDDPQIFSHLIREYLFVSIFRACVESLVSENASRLAHMQRAQDNIEETVEHLQTKYHQSRQTAIDSELFDIVAGFEALMETEGSEFMPV